MKLDELMDGQMNGLMIERKDCEQSSFSMLLRKFEIAVTMVLKPVLV